MAELTLQLDPALLQKVNRWAESRGMSVNEAIAALIGQIPNQDSSLELSPWTQSLVGTSGKETEVLDDETLRQQYLDYLEEKYK
ncbi:hypothetical protein NIES2135_52580 [Leptolyngbya boryana NIES-2135]|jgi:hypothetical protein|uniref:Uncharacterized protein n=1 Tax=Leptolyngbya boryana NIES-2135 TaxID=1973484 RepID=A0A1Z4JNN7_LEPBY|nr:MULTISPECIES: DUF6364 family protein [Leptolyngbya]BAY58385.1 hypothetical protein NIES2135_52580 [Leptolyngbya boryana NIES-2135]MBD2368059.1 hypothetical protein [Leptolyngbya sp. FACHB-161]MBD2374583.1 hypothetical protein [Leptolyngbya sp. FACHB-238]MBD2399005.1 hypothetical protein [Leptolyngbya sp. FACHB-239]MBD2405394.1 hypothetical protein [Leptolyngbya sp. FACHB-402]